MRLEAFNCRIPCRVTWFLASLWIRPWLCQAQAQGICLYWDPPFILFVWFNKVLLLQFTLSPLGTMFQSWLVYDRCLFDSQFSNLTYHYLQYMVIIPNMLQPTQQKVRALETSQKALLIEDIHNGTIIHTMQPAAICSLRPEYDTWKKPKFVANLRRLQTTLNDKKTCARNDDSLVELVYKGKTELHSCWNHSRLLKDDTCSGNYERLGMEGLYKSRPEYTSSCTSLTAFWIRIGKSRTAEKGTIYWRAKRLLYAATMIIFMILSLMWRPCRSDK